MSNKELYGLISIAVFVFGEMIYVWSIYRDRTRPHVFSWLIWGLLTGVTFFAQLAKGAGAGAWVTGFTSVVCLLIAILALFKGEKNITRSDVVAFIGGLGSILIWRATGDPFNAVVIVCAAELFAFYPTLRKSWRKPWEEPALPYALDMVKYMLSLLAMKKYTPTAVVYPFFVSFVQILFVAMLLYRRAKLDAKRVTK